MVGLVAERIPNKLHSQQRAAPEGDRCLPRRTASIAPAGHEVSDLFKLVTNQQT